MIAWRLVIALLGSAFLLGACNHPEPAPRAHTEQDLKELYYTMRIIEADSGRSIEQELALSVGTNLLDKLLHLVKQRQVAVDPKSAALTGVDGYGRHFDIALRSELLSQRVAPALTNLPYPIILWSSGNNGKNEWGFGDDICLKTLP